MSDPQFVKLVEARRDGVLTDPKSHWSIAGNDVLPFPTVHAEVAFVRRSISLAKLEEATEQDYEDAHPPFPKPITIKQGSTEPSAPIESVTGFWFDTTDPFNVVPKIYVGGEWTAIADAPAPLPTGIYVQSSTPGATTAGYLWIDTSSTPVAKVYDSGWVELSLPDDPGFQLPAGLYVQSSQPGSADPDEIWFDTDNAEVRKFDGADWILLGIPGADLPADVYVQDEAPEGAQSGSFWFDTDDMIASILIDGDWIAMILPTPGVTVADSAPGSPSENDIWVNTDDSPITVQRRVSGSWVSLTNTVEITQEDYDALGAPNVDTIYLVIG